MVRFRPQCDGSAVTNEEDGGEVVECIAESPGRVVGVEFDAGKQGGKVVGLGRDEC